MQLLRKRVFVWAGSGSIVIVLLVLFFHIYQHPLPSKTIDLNQDVENSVAKLNHQDKSSKEDNNQDQQVIMVDVKGAVKKPNVYKFNVGDRVFDAIKKSGGLRDDADEKHINLAEKLVDEMVIYVPIKGEVPTSINETSGSMLKSKDDKTAINSATLEELEALSGIGPTKAQAIIDYRNQNGPFKSINDLLNVSGIGEKSLERIKDKIRLN